MTRQEQLYHTMISENIFTHHPMMIITKNYAQTNGDIVEAVASRPLTDVEIKTYFLFLAKYIAQTTEHDGAIEVAKSNGEKVTFTYSKEEDKQC